MGKGRYSIVFNSPTGNTKKLADTIYAVLAKENCDYFGVPKEGGLYSEMLYIGFWTDKGNADKSTLTLLSTLKNKKIFLFGTAGFGGSEAYFQKILNHVKQSIDSSNSVVGEYMCQGKMPPSVRERYMKMKVQPEHPENIDALIENFDRALSHPDGRALGQSSQSAHRYFPDAPAVPSFSCSVPVQTAAFCPDTYILRPRNCLNR